MIQVKNVGESGENPERVRHRNQMSCFHTLCHKSKTIGFFREGENYSLVCKSGYPVLSYCCCENQYISKPCIKNKIFKEITVMKNVMKIECKDGCVLLTDLMERTVAIEGTLESANLVDGFVIVKETA